MNLSPTTFARLLAAVVFLGLVAGCAFEPITGRAQLQIYSEDKLNELGAASYQQILDGEPVAAGTRESAQITRVGERLSAVADRWLAENDREPFVWEFKLIDSDQLNAFALPGGKVAFYRGILPVCRDDTGVAVVMGHEIAHAYLKHGGARVSRDVLTKFSFEAVMLALGGDQASDTAKATMQALGVGYNVGVALPFSRGDESAADRVGLYLMAEAGYDPSQAMGFWQRMSQAKGGKGPPEMLSTHPADETRVRQIEEYLDMPDEDGVTPRQLYQRNRR